MNAAFVQIGNAVPPLLTKALAQTMLAAVRAAVPKSRRTGKPGADKHRPLPLFGEQFTGCGE
jgi:hypothetical protein